LRRKERKLTYSIMRLESLRYTGFMEEKEGKLTYSIMRLESQCYTGFMEEKGRKTHIFHHEAGVTALAGQPPLEPQLAVQVGVLPVQLLLK